MVRPLAIAIHGASGRMGQAMVRVAQSSDAVRLVAALVRGGSPLEGRQVNATPIADSLRYAAAGAADFHAAVLVDFSVASAFDQALRIARHHGCAFVSGTTALDARQRTALDDAAATIPVLWSANFSLGIAVLMRLAADAARALASWDCVIAEAHHAGKRDAPSGTALALGQVVASARGHDFVQPTSQSVDAETRRESTSIGFAVTRAGDIIGEHTVTLATHGERIELIHRATDRDVFARGALAAACWLAGRPPGVYSMGDMVRA